MIFARFRRILADFGRFWRLGGAARGGLSSPLKGGDISREGTRGRNDARQPTWWPTLPSQGELRGDSMSSSHISSLPLESIARPPPHRVEIIHLPIYPSENRVGIQVIPYSLPTNLIDRVSLTDDTISVEGMPFKTETGGTIDNESLPLSSNATFQRHRRG